MDSGEVSFSAPTGWTAPQGINGTAGYTTVSSTGTLAKVEDAADSATGWATGTACATSAPAIDASIKHENTASVSCGNGNEASGDVWYKSISSENWSTYTTVGFWIYSSGALTSGHLQFSYDDTASLASPLESISIPAISATTWTYVTLAFGATTRTAVIAYGFRINNVSGLDNKTVKVDDILLGPHTTPTFSGQDGKIRLLALASSQTVTFVYGSGGGASGATASSTLGAATFTVKNRIDDSVQTLTAIAASPSVDVAPTATKVLTGLTGQTVNGVAIASSCPAPGGGVAVTIAGTPTAQSAGAEFKACVYAVDDSNRLDSLATNNTSITSTPNDSQGVYPSAANLVSGKGTFLITLNTSTSYTVTATPASITAGTSSSITVNSGSTTKLVITTNPSSVTAGSETTSFVVTRRDQYNNATTTGTQTVNLASTSTGLNKQFRDSAGGGSVSSVVIGNSASTEDFFYYDDKSGSWSISVAFSGLTGDSKTLTVNPGSTTTLVITSNPSSVTAGNETTAYVVTRRDQYGNSVTSGTQTVNLSSTSVGANKQFRDTAGGSSVSSVVIGSGASTENFFYYDEAAGSYTVAVAFTGLTGDSKSLTVNAAAVNKLIITSAPSSHIAGNETTSYVVTRRDQFNNPITSGTQTVNLSSTSTGLNKQFRDTAGGGSVSSVTIGAGSSTEDFFYYDEKAGSWSISVAFGGLTGDATGLTTNPAATSKLLITSNPSSVTAGNETTAYVVTRRDQFDNLTSSGSQTVNLTSTSIGANKQFRDTAGGGSVSLVTIAGGSSTEDFYYYDEAAGSYAIAVAFTGLTGDSKPLTVDATTTTTIVLTTFPSALTAGNETTAYVVTRRDQYGNSVTSGTQTVNLSSTSTGANKQFRDTSSSGSVGSIVIADGSATEDFFYYDDKSGSWTIAVAASGLTGDSKTLTVSPGASAVLVITANPSVTTAGTETAAYTVERRDSFANLVTSGSLSVNLSSTSTGANKQFRETSGGSAVSSVSIGNGTSSKSFFYYDEKAGSWTITVAASGLTGDSKMLGISPAATARLVIISGPTSVAAGTETAAYTVERRDAFGNVTTSGSQVVELASSSNDATKQFRDSNGGPAVTSITITNSASTEDFYYYDPAAGSYVLRVSASGLAGDSATLTVTGDAPPATEPTPSTTTTETTPATTTTTETTSVKPGIVPQPAPVELAPEPSQPEPVTAIAEPSPVPSKVSFWINIVNWTTDTASALVSLAGRVSRTVQAQFKATTTAVGARLVAIGVWTQAEVNQGWKGVIGATKTVSENVKLTTLGGYQTSTTTLAIIGQRWEAQTNKLALTLTVTKQAADRQAQRVQAAANRIDLAVEKFKEIVFDREPNHITNVKTEVASSGEVLITWETNHLSTSQVNFGSAVGVYEHSQFDKTQTRNHRVSLTKLEPKTTYFYELISKNGDYAIDAFRSFTTP